MPSNHTNGSISHRRTLSSKIAAASVSQKPQKHSLSSRVRSHPKLSGLGKKRNTEIEFSGDSTTISPSVGHLVTTPVSGNNHTGIEEDMTFLQYCPTCDKQILTPNSQVLYCSESCRRKDSLSSSPPLELKLAIRPSSIHTYSPKSPFSNMALEIDPLDPVSTEETTRLAPSIAAASLPVLTTKPPELHSFKKDLDPTEWKPNSMINLRTSNLVSAVNPLPFVIPNCLPDEDDQDIGDFIREHGSSETTVQQQAEENEPGNTRPDNVRRQSAAFGYLAQFHRSASSFLSLSAKRPSIRSFGSTSTMSMPGNGRKDHHRARTTGSTSVTGTPAMSLSRSSRSSSTSSSSSGIALYTPEHEGGGSGGVARNSEIRPGTSSGGELAFGKETIATVEAVGLSMGSTGAEGTLRGLLARET